ncbi:aspartyl/asparaginyl beta-hydroxylase domain-containing protein [Archangium lansingense]|uniref:Aspartyl/asparaginyl beta-hydroxylase domain-containing protein n=1 Tax=Archangium lansingense TaxID=2995310 RepID=A0ABT4AB42_9BACT|nr:aspartyl/asparaginyl beta-hydroxylase domain-containing protein [Archangium lansinium]MCY1078860.1 aspartyl/asparaginyl beta-hydroxylase domain-containing protein [Archangium lansinium]
MAIDIPEMLSPEAAEKVQSVLGECIAKHGEAKLHRILEGLQIAFGEKEPRYPHPLQRPELLYIPGLPSKPWYSPDEYPSLKHATRTLEASASAMREEYLRASTEQSHLATYMPGKHEKFYTLQDDSQWMALFLRKEGKLNASNLQACPETARVIDSLAPLLMSDGEAFFSVLKPGTVLPPHHDATNCKLTIHMAITIPPDCGIRVGGEERQWTEGRCVVFDDTFLHEAWNKSTQTRICFIMDVWHPALSEEEIDTLRALIAAVPRNRAQAPAA